MFNNLPAAKDIVVEPVLFVLWVATEFSLTGPAFSFLVLLHEKKSIAKTRTENNVAVFIHSKGRN